MEQEITKYILKSPVYATLDGEKCKNSYRMILQKRDNNWVISPQQSFNGEFNQYSGLPGWNVLSLLSKGELISDNIFIDFGQRWAICGMKKVMEEVNSFLIEQGE